MASFCWTNHKWEFQIMKERKSSKFHYQLLEPGNIRAIPYKNMVIWPYTLTSSSLQCLVSCTYSVQNSGIQFQWLEGLVVTENLKGKNGWEAVNKGGKYNVEKQSTKPAGANQSSLLICILVTMSRFKNPDCITIQSPASLQLNVLRMGLSFKCCLHSSVWLTRGSLIVYRSNNSVSEF